MSFVLIYTEGGLEKSSEPMFSLDLINQHIRDLYDAEDANAPITVLAVQEDRDDAPRTWNRPEAPADVNRVLGADTGQEWVRREMGPGSRSHWSNGSYSLTWVELLDHERKLTAVVETKVEAAARRLRERRERGDLHTNSPDANIVLAHVLGGGQL